MDILNPATGALIATLPDTTAEQAQKQYETARAAQPLWAAKPLEERIQVLGKFYELLDEHADKMAEITTSEVGKPLGQSKGEIAGARKRIKFFLDQSMRYLADEIVYEEEGLKEIISYEPLGVIGNISAWNYPYLVGTNVFVPALLAGNAVMYKPSEYSSLTGEQIVKLLHLAGVHADAVQLAIGGGEVGKTLLEMPFDGYYFTGSYKTGQYIYEKVAPKMVPCQLELGGKDPLYIADDVADIAGVAAGTADGAFYNNGQSCCSVERIYVHEKVYDQYVAEFVKEVNSYKLGAPTEDGVYIGALTREPQLQVVDAQVQDAVSKGAKVETGGKRVEGKGYFYQPTVLTGVNHTMEVMREESFGPVIGIMKVKDDAEAAQLMNDTAYGLTAGVYTADQQRAKTILSNINAGTGYWNCCDRVSAALPWSGRKHSGFGATLSHLGLRAFTHPKAYHLRG